MGVLRRIAGQDLGPGYCVKGRCVNCMSCNAECNMCDCNTLTNTCCCDTPPGHYSNGFAKVACPGGTFQDRMGHAHCKSCNSSYPNTLYNLHKTGATTRMDCRANMCDNHCDPSLLSVADLAACRATNCVTGNEVQAWMSLKKRNTTFCARLGIDSHECSWIDWSAAHSRVHM